MKGLVLCIPIMCTLLSASCAQRKKVSMAQNMSVDLVLPSTYNETEEKIKAIAEIDSLTTYTDKGGIKHTIGKNTLDSKTGEQLMSVELQEVQVTAKFKNIAERQGFAIISFNIQIPLELLNDNWELYLTPETSIELPGVIIAGQNFIAKQNKQYNYYNELRKVILPENDIDQFIKRKDLEKQLAEHNRMTLRNAKLSYRRSFNTKNYKLSTRKDTIQFISNYMDKNKVNRNEYFKRVLAEQFENIVKLKKRKNIKAEIIASQDSTINYTYSAEIPAIDTSGKIAITMKAELRTLNADIYQVCTSDSISFIISSLRSFVEDKNCNTKYANGLQLLRSGKYEQAIEILRPYADYNTAIAYLALGYDLIAYNTLQRLPATANNLYLQAISMMRLGNEEEALSLYKKSCEIDHTKTWRGNLDPEISLLIKKYQLNNENE